jgi:hypothetical protein
MNKDGNWLYLSLAKSKVISKVSSFFFKQKQGQLKWAGLRVDGLLACCWLGK